MVQRRHDILQINYNIKTFDCLLAVNRGRTVTVDIMIEHLFNVQSFETCRKVLFLLEIEFFIHLQPFSVQTIYI